MDNLKPSDLKNVERRDQSPQPNYPNFDPIKLGGQTKLGQIGWGLTKPTL